ncbi:uncharacterized protein BBA_02167 [Beauveria bassiana ARSEF 2860]|uniref:Uncharacterized protein n=1 Tax=Beauveria bassiana (strain ARSEF 2860) TaxID=655819 RepID=J4UTH5_BEAB2|nr:uncharacterized protein BBA_02167 [Beauveria bassiana ARSEF 2860]EJP69132.1 hypothetical protein BBA_02167 [Beauveria bassiana ARSEF 2860]
MPYQDGLTIRQEDKTSLGQGVHHDAVTMSGKDEVKPSEELDHPNTQPDWANESPKVEIKVFNNLESFTDPETKVVTTYDCSQWYEYNGYQGWTRSRFRFCFPTDTNRFTVTVFRDTAQYYWGTAWYNEDDAYPASVNFEPRLKDAHLDPPQWTEYGTYGNTDKEFSFGPVGGKLKPGKYEAEVLFSQTGPYWNGDQTDDPHWEVDETGPSYWVGETVPQVVKFNITVSIVG